MDKERLKERGEWIHYIYALTTALSFRGDENIEYALKELYTVQDYIDCIRYALSKKEKITKYDVPESKLRKTLSVILEMLGGANHPSVVLPHMDEAKWRRPVDLVAYILIYYDPEKQGYNHIIEHLRTKDHYLFCIRHVLASSEDLGELFTTCPPDAKMREFLYRLLKHIESEEKSSDKK